MGFVTVIQVSGVRVCAIMLAFVWMMAHVYAMLFIEALAAS